MANVKRASATGKPQSEPSKADRIAAMSDALRDWRVEITERLTRHRARLGLIELQPLYALDVADILRMLRAGFLRDGVPCDERLEWGLAYRILRHEAEPLAEWECPRLRKKIADDEALLQEVDAMRSRPETWMRERSPTGKSQRNSAYWYALDAIAIWRKNPSSMTARMNVELSILDALFHHERVTGKKSRTPQDILAEVQENVDRFVARYEAAPSTIRQARYPRGFAVELLDRCGLPAGSFRKIRRR